MNKLKSKLKSKKGFTLIEMLIVVAIVAILVAIAVPVVNSSLEKARESTDEANIRTAKILATSGVASETITPNTYYLNKDTGKLETTKGDSSYKGQSTKYGKDKALKITVDANGSTTVAWE